MQTCRCRVCTYNRKKCNHNCVWGWWHISHEDRRRRELLVVLFLCENIHAMKVKGWENFKFTCFRKEGERTANTHLLYNMRVFCSGNCERMNYNAKDTAAGALRVHPVKTSFCHFSVFSGNWLEIMTIVKVDSPLVALGAVGKGLTAIMYDYVIL